MEPPAGLVNAGNSCYLNSTLQALGSSPSFVQYCHDLDAALNLCSPPGGDASGQAGAQARWGLKQLASAVAAAVLGFLVGEPSSPLARPDAPRAGPWGTSGLR